MAAKFNAGATKDRHLEAALLHLEEDLEREERIAATLRQIMICLITTTDHNANMACTLTHTSVCARTWTEDIV